MSRVAAVVFALVSGLAIASPQAAETMPASGKISAIPPSQRLHLILLGVEDVARSVKFYEALGWKKSPSGNEGFVKFDMGGYALCLLSREAFAKDAQSPTAKGSGFSGVGLAYLAKSADEVPLILARAVAAGGTVVKPVTKTAWGVAAYFKDPDGHLFEIDYEDAWVFDAEHKLVVDKVNAK